MEANEALQPTAAEGQQEAIEERKFDVSKMNKPRVRVIKIPFDQDPLGEGEVFQLKGCVYICYQKKTRGRSLIRLLGEAEPVEQVEPVEELSKQPEGAAPQIPVPVTPKEGEDGKRQ